MNDLERHWALVKEGRLRQNERCLKAGKPLKWPKLAAEASKPAQRPSKAQKPPMPESGDTKDSLLSFDEWKACGWSVKKGEKFHSCDINGVPQFSRDQVRRDNPAWAKFRSKK